MKEYKEYGVYVKNERYYSVKGKEIKNIKAYYQACRTKEHCQKYNLIQDRFGIYVENGVTYNKLGQVILYPDLYIEACLRNEILRGKNI